VPGIVGIVEKGGGVGRYASLDNAVTVQRMLSVMRYESFYESGHLSCDELGLSAGWVGPRGSSPCHVLNGQDNISAWVSGQPYTDRCPGTAQAADPCRDILDSYLRVGGAFLSEIRGPCSGMLFDRKREQGFIFNDRFGVERLFLFEDDIKIIFASEAKAILSIVPETRGFDIWGLGEFLACGCTLGEHSLFHKIKVLPCGEALYLGGGKPLRIHSYCDREAWELSEPLPRTEFLRRFCGELKDIVSGFSKAPPGAAVSLTGGLDSRMIVACLSTQEETVPCYTFGSMYRDTYDVRAAREVARRCRQPHKVLVLGEEFLSGFGRYLNKAVLVSDGYLGFSGAAELYLNTMAREVAPLRITGNFGGELLRGFRAFRCSIPKGGFMLPELLGYVTQATALCFDFQQMHPVSFTLFVQAPSGYGRYAIERSQVTPFSPFLDKNLVELAYRKPASGCYATDASVSVVKECCPDLLSIPTDRGLLGTEMTAVRTARRVYREAVFKLEYWSGHGMPDWLSSIAASPCGLLGDLLFRGKHKFQHFRSWLRAQLAQQVREIVHDTPRGALADLLDFPRVRAMMDEHIQGRRNYTQEIDMIVTLILAEQILLRQRTRMNQRNDQFG